jgi:rhodanese-related sulfurtransferase
LQLSCTSFKEKFFHEKPTFETEIIFTCRSGRRANEASEIATKLGFQK